MPPKLELSHHVDRGLDLMHDGVRLFRYTYRPDVAQSESPKPYFHPLRTLSGNTVTIFRPHDHRWHTGLAMTLSHVADQNFWGGPSYVQGQGYVQLNNNGTQRHDAWSTIDVNQNRLLLEQQLTWITQGGQPWFEENRTMQAGQIDPVEGRWTLDFNSCLKNVSDRVLAIGSPTTEGRASAGYGSLFWRGPRCFTFGHWLASDDRTDPEKLRGQRSPWLAFVGTHDRIDAQSTLVFVDHPSNPRYPTQWFVRSDPYACASFAFMFDQEYQFQPEAVLNLTYRMIIADGALSRDTIESLIDLT